MYKPSLSATLKAASELEFVDDSIDYLRKFDSASLRLVLKIMWDPEIKFHKDLPDGDVPYNPSPFDEPGRLYSELKRLYLFLDPESAKALGLREASPNITKQQRQNLWIQLLESISHDDAILLENMRNKRTPWKRISRHLTKKAFPGLIEGE